MKLLYWASCPFACKVLAFLEETDLLQTTDLIPIHPYEKGKGLSQFNPLLQIPTLIMDSGEALMNSSLICAYLDTLHGMKKLVPENNEAKWHALKMQAIADGIMEASVMRVLEEQARHAKLRSNQWIQRQNMKLIHALDFLEKNSDGLSINTLTIAEISVATALSYLNFRFPEELWGEKRPSLLKWHQAVLGIPSLKNSHPQEKHPLPESDRLDHLT